MLGSALPGAHVADTRMGGVGVAMARCQHRSWFFDGGVRLLGYDPRCNIILYVLRERLCDLRFIFHIWLTQVH